MEPVKKKVSILSILMISILLTGCTIVRMDTKSIDTIIDVILSKDNNLYNHVGKGYKYYIPRGVSYIDTNDFNDKLYSNGNYYYLYVDVIGYYYNQKVLYEEETSYYSRYIDMNGKEGYLVIKEQNGKYYIRFMYNYSLIETIVDKGDINDAVLDATYMLSTVKFNPNVVKLMIENTDIASREEKYDIFTSKQENNYFKLIESIEPDDSEDLEDSIDEKE